MGVGGGVMVSGGDGERVGGVMITEGGRWDEEVGLGGWGGVKRWGMGWGGDGQ